MTRTRLALLVLTGLGLAACSAPPPPAPPTPPLTIGPAPAKPTGQIDTSGAVDENSGYVQAGQWPNACDLITNADILSIFPQLKGIVIDHQPSTQTFDFTDIGSMDVPDANCAISFNLLGEDETSQITFGIDAVGDPDQVQDNGMYDSAVAPGCAYHAPLLDDGPNKYICGRIEFTVDEPQLELPTYYAFRPDRFSVDGKITTFPQGQYTAEDAFEDTHITAALVAAVIQKLPAS